MEDEIIRKYVDEKWKKLGLIGINDKLLKFYITLVSGPSFERQYAINAEVLKNKPIDHIDIEFKVENNNN